MDSITTHVLGKALYYCLGDKSTFPTSELILSVKGVGISIKMLLRKNSSVEFTPALLYTLAYKLLKGPCTNLKSQYQIMSNKVFKIKECKLDPVKDKPIIDKNRVASDLKDVNLENLHHNMDPEIAHTARIGAVLLCHSQELTHTQLIKEIESMGILISLPSDYNKYEILYGHKKFNPMVESFAVELIEGGTIDVKSGIWDVYKDKSSVVLMVAPGYKKDDLAANICDAEIDIPAYHEINPKFPRMLTKTVMTVSIDTTKAFVDPTYTPDFAIMKEVKDTNKLCSSSFKRVSEKELYNLIKPYIKTTGPHLSPVHFGEYVTASYAKEELGTFHVLSTEGNSGKFSPEMQERIKKVEPMAMELYPTLINSGTINLNIYCFEAIQNTVLGLLILVANGKIRRCFSPDFELMMIPAIIKTILNVYKNKGELLNAL